VEISLKRVALSPLNC